MPFCGSRSRRFRVPTPAATKKDHLRHSFKQLFDACWVGERQDEGCGSWLNYWIGFAICHLPFTNWHHFVNDYLHSYLMVTKSQLVFTFVGICQLLMALLLPDDTFLLLKISLINQKETSLLWDRCCHQTVWLHLIVPNYMLIEVLITTFR